MPGFEDGRLANIRIVLSGLVGTEFCLVIRYSRDLGVTFCLGGDLRRKYIHGSIDGFVFFIVHGLEMK